MPSKKIIAATGMGITHLEKNVVFTYFISVDPDYRKMGFARKLVRARFDLMKEKYPGKILELSGYTAMGDLFVKPIIHEISKEYPEITIRDKSNYLLDGHVYKAMKKALEEKRSFVDVDEFA
jgi:GNAT superfamily N-acetyltransferase